MQPPRRVASAGSVCSVLNTAAEALAAKSTKVESWPTGADSPPAGVDSPPAGRPEAGPSATSAAPLEGRGSPGITSGMNFVRDAASISAATAGGSSMGEGIA
eukprot:195929-Prorocentrum_minimum.AAC.2